MSLSRTRTLKRPSCGMRRSEMSRPDMILIREMTELCRSFGTVRIMRIRPSIRMRTTISVSRGSRWISLARSLMARSMMELTRRMVGALLTEPGGLLTLHLLDGAGRALVAVEHLNGTLDLRGVGHHGHHLLAHGLAHFLNGVEVQRVRHRKIQFVLLLAHGDDLVLLGDILRHGGGKLRRDVDLAQVHILDAKLHLQGFDQLILRDDVVCDQHLAQTALLCFLQLKPAVKLLLRDRSGGKQQLAQTTIKGHGASSP